VSEHPARQLWKRLESIHAVTYFSPERAEAHVAVGLRGFWMGYFATRAAPLGPVVPGVIDATFFNFAPRKVRKAIPDAWTFATPAAILEARRSGAAAALRRLHPAIGRVAKAVAPRLRTIVDAGAAAGRPLFAANRDLGLGDDDAENLWLLTTCLREHRGDGHVALLTSHGLDGCEAHVLVAAERELSPDLFLRSRGWTDDEWTAAEQRLSDRGLTDNDGITTTGRVLRALIEDATDELASEPMRTVDVESLCRDLDAAALDVVAAGEIRFPNPMGLPRLEPDDLV
jgi:hypothetical protein